MCTEGCTAISWILAFHVKISIGQADCACDAAKGSLPWGDGGSEAYLRIPLYYGTKVPSNRAWFTPKRKKMRIGCSRGVNTFKTLKAMRESYEWPAKQMAARV